MRLYQILVQSIGWNETNSTLQIIHVGGKMENTLESISHKIPTDMIFYSTIFLLEEV